MIMRREIADFSRNPSVYDAYRAGIAQSMLERLRAGGGAADPLRTVFPKDSEAKIRQAFRDDRAFDEFKSRLLEESKMLNTEKAGFRRTAIDTDLDSQEASGVGRSVQAALSGRSVQAALEALRATFPRVTGMPEQTAQSVASKLTTPTTGLDSVIEGILRSLQAEEAALKSQSALVNIGGALAGSQAAARKPTPQYPEDTQGREDGSLAGSLGSPLSLQR